MTATDAIATAILGPEGLVPTAYRASSLEDAERFEPPGAYTVSRTYRRDHVLELDAHLDRLEESALLLKQPARLDRAALRAALRTLVDGAGYPESRFRITIPAADPRRVHLAIEPLAPVPPALRRDGVTTSTIGRQRPNPRAKSTRWLSERRALRAAMDAGAYEGLLTSADGLLLEGLTSNFYAVAGGELRTASTGILHGISRRIVLEVAPGVLPVRTEPIGLADVARLGEAFLSSSSRGVLPIVAIDRQRIGDGRPGPSTGAIAALYEQWTAEHLAPI